VPNSLRREGRAMLDAVVADFERVAETSVVTLIDEACQPNRFHELAASCDWTLVIAPEFDDRLANRAQTVLDAGGRLLGPLPGAIRLTADKLQLARVWHHRAVAHPPTFPHNVKDLPSLPFPWVLKPRDGAGSQNIFLAFRDSDPEQIARQEWTKCEMLLQQYVFGQAVSVAVLIGAQQIIPLAPCRQHLEGWNLRYEGGSLPLPPPLAERATKLALQAVAGIPGLQGYVGVDLVLGDDGADFAIEINPRLTTSYIGLRQLCEQNLAELMLRAVRGEKIETPAWKAGEVHFQADGAIRMQTP
jgi:tyramine---L-glutamate ligase